jgi:hypothetical protein
MITLNEYRVQVSSVITHIAIIQGDTIYVSPAMLSLLQSEEGEDLDHLLRCIPVVRFSIESPTNPPVLGASYE